MKSLCVDTSFLVDLWEEYHPPDEFPELWRDVLPSLIEAGLFYAPHEVFEELSGKAPGLKKWAHENRKMFRKPDKQTCTNLKEILARFPKVVDRFKRGPHADALVAAMGKTFDAIVVTRERRDGADPNLQKPRVPTICRNCGIACFVTVREFRGHIGWPVPGGQWALK